MTSCSMKNEVCGFQCTGADFSDEWDHLHNTVVPRMIKRCEVCGEHAGRLFKFDHDHVGLGLGKNAFDKKIYNEVYEEIVCVHNKCKADGRC